MLDKQAQGITPFCHSLAPTDYTVQLPTPASWGSLGEPLSKVSTLLLWKCPSRLPADHQSSRRPGTLGQQLLLLPAEKPPWTEVMQTDHLFPCPLESLPPRNTP